jgi:lysophospholipase L1-like esterase
LLGLAARTLLVAAAVTISLLTFPAGMPWMIAAWLACASWLAIRSRDTRWPVAVAAAVVLLKGTEWTLPLVLIALASACLAVASPIGQQRTRRACAVAAIVFAWIGWAWYAWDSHAAATAGEPKPIDVERPLVLLGDSLTAGIGRNEGCAAPLGEILAVRVVDLSTPGATASAARRRLADLDALRPGIVVVELGGNDFMQGRTREEARDDLEHIVQHARGLDAEVILMAAPRGLIRDSYAEIELSLARQYDLHVIHDSVFRWIVLRGATTPIGAVLGEPYPTDDGLHPNSRGSRLVAERIAAALRDIYGPQVLTDGQAVPTGN